MSRNNEFESINVTDKSEKNRKETNSLGQVNILPGNTSHFHWAKSSEYITQVTAIGPLGLEYVSSKDDPRKVAG